MSKYLFPKGHKINLGRVPWDKGIPRSEEVKRKISLKRKGQHNSPETEFKKGYIPWNKAKKIWGEKPHPTLGRKHSEKSKEKIRETRKRLFLEGRLKSPNKGKQLSSETRLKISLSKKGKPNTKESETKRKLFREGKLVPWNKSKPFLQKENNPFWNKKHTEITRQKISRSLKNWYNSNKISYETTVKRRNSMKFLWKDQIYREKVIKNSLKGLLKRPTSLESKMIEFLGKNNLPFRYTGNGSFLIGYKNPDFICTDGRNLCIEVCNRFHHQGNWREERIRHFKKYDWKCLVIWWDEIFSDNYGVKLIDEWEERILAKINKFTSS